LAQMNHSELSHMAGAVDDSTINIVVVIIIIIIISSECEKVINTFIVFDYSFMYLFGLLYCKIVSVLFNAFHNQLFC